MKRNTGSCGHGGHDQCAPQMNCDKVKADAVFSDAKKFPLDKFASQPDCPVMDADVVLADIDLEVDVEADVCLPHHAREIKWMKKNVSLKQCKAVPSSKDPKLVKLFITGILHKNIAYVDSCSGALKDYSTDVYFTTIEKVWLDNPVRNPFGKEDIKFSQKLSVSEYRELDKHGHGANNCVTGSETNEFFNEPVRCKLLGAKIREIDLLKDYDHWGRFNKITEKMEIRLFLKLKQKQQVTFDPYPYPAPQPCDD